jgi:hypothetical protein
MGKEIKKFKEYSNLSSDAESETFDMDGNKISGPLEIESIIDVFTDPSEIPGVSESASGISFNTDLSVKEVKRGDNIWITALLRKPGTTSFNSPAVQGVIKVRVVDIYYGLQYLNKVINNG